MNLSTIIAFLIAPTIALVLVLMASRILDKKNLTHFASSYFLGLLTVIPMIIGLYYASQYGLVENARSLRRYLLFSFVAVGLAAELTKFLLLRYYFIPKEEVNKPFDGILYSVLIAMGFATAANIYYFFVWPPPFSLPVVSFSLPFANLIIGIILGFFAGYGKFRKNHVDYLTGLGAAIFFQGFYTFGILAHDYLLVALVGSVTAIIAILLSVKSINSNAEQMF